MTPDTQIVLQTPEGESFATTAGFFNAYPEGITNITDGWKILSKDGKFTELKTVMIRHETDHVNIINTVHGQLKLTDKHIVPVTRDGIDIEIPASEIQIGDTLIDGKFDEFMTARRDTFVNLMDIIEPTENIVINESDLIRQMLKENKLTTSFYKRKEKFHNKVLTGWDYSDRITLSDYSLVRDDLFDIGFDESQLSISLRGGRRSIPMVLELSRELGQFLGYLYSEGSVAEYLAVLTNSNPDVLRQYHELGDKLFPGVTRGTSFNVNNCGIVGFNCGALAYVLRNGLGYHFGSGNLRVPEWFFNANPEFLKGFIAAYLEGDGCIDAQHASLITCSGEFAYQLQYILKLFNITSSVSFFKTAGTIARFKHAESIRNFDTYAVVIQHRDIAKLNLYECSKIGKLINTDVEISEVRNYNTVKSITKMEYDGRVYDFETGNHYFVANGQIVHNCCQIPLDKLLQDGFNTGHGCLRTPTTIGSASTLTCIAIQSSQNDFFDFGDF